MKKIFKLLAVTTAVCAAGLAGCSSSSSSGLSIDSYWYVDCYPRIQNSAIGTEEVLVYDVYVLDGSVENNSFHLTVDDGASYTTRMGIGLYSWDSNSFTAITSENASGYMSGGNYVAGENEEYVYYLCTELTYSGSYVYGGTDTAATGSNSHAFDSTVTTVTYFRTAQDKLAPIYSMSYVKDTVPNAMDPSGVDDMCYDLEYTYETQYNKDCSSATYTYTNIMDGKDAVTSQISTGNAENTVFDNNQIYVAIRGMNLSSSFSATVSLLSPADGGFTDVDIACSSTSELGASSDEAVKAVEDDVADVLVAAYGDPSSVSEDSTASGINYNTVTVSASSGKGITQTVWYAAVESETYNQYRATPAYMEIPMSYSLGTMTYTLRSISSQIAPDV